MCETKYKQNCVTVEEDECYIDYELVHKQEPYSVTECTDVLMKKCNKIWVTKSYGEVFVEDPNDCTNFYETDCKKVTKYRDIEVKEEIEKCHKVPCNTCNQVAYEECKVCETKYNTNCITVEEDECYNDYEIEHVQEPSSGTECSDVLTKKFNKILVTQYDGSKVFEEDPNDCSDFKETQCKQVTKYHNRQVKKVIQKCHKVPRHTCQQVPYEDCNVAINHGG